MFAAVALITSVLSQQPSKAKAHVEPPQAADRVILKDGSIILGQVTNTNDRGKLVMIVRRDWVTDKLPEKSRIWHAAEAPWLARARGQRLERLEAWRNDRRSGLADAAGDDALLKSIDLEIERIKNLKDDDLPPLMMIALDRRDVTKTERKPETVGRLLRLGWQANLPDVETIAPADLRRALTARNVPDAGNEPVNVDDLLPMPIETEPHWRLRRAATEVMQDKSLWLARHGDLVMNEAAAGDGAALAGMLPGLLRSLTGEAPASDPLTPKLQALAAKGAVGAVVTQLEFQEDLTGVKVESTFWVRGDEGWKPAGRETAVVNTSEIRPGDDANIQNDERVQGVFKAFDLLGDISPDMKQRALAIGAATQRATDRAKGLLREDLSQLAISFGTP